MNANAASVASSPRWKVTLSGDFWRCNVDKERRAGAESGGRGKRERRELGADSESPVRRSASPPSPKLRTASQAELCKEVGSQEKRKLRAQRGKARSVWLG